MTEDEMVGWHHRLDGHEFEQAPGGSKRRGSLECYSPWVLRELDTTEQLSVQIDTFELWCWRIPWTARRSNKSILKEISPGVTLEGLILKLKLQYFGHLM